MRTHFNRRRFVRRVLTGLGCAAFANVAVVAEELGTVHDWNCNFARQNAQGRVPEIIEGLGFAGDGSKFATRDDLGGVRIHETLSRRKLRDIEVPLPWNEAPPHRVARLPFAFSPEGKLIAVAKPKRPLSEIGDEAFLHDVRGTIVVREVDTARIVFELAYPDHHFPEISMGRKNIIAFGGRSRFERDAHGTVKDIHETVRVWDCTTGAEKCVYTPRVPPDLNYKNINNVSIGSVMMTYEPRTRPNSTDGWSSPP